MIRKDEEARSVATKMSSMEQDMYRPDVLPHLQLGYRVEVAKQMMETARATNVIFIDDINNAVDPHQQPALHGLAGYMRCTLPAAVFAAVGETHVLTFTPPLISEVALAKKAAETMGGKNAGNNLHIWMPSTENPASLIDLTRLLDTQAGIEAYSRLIIQTGDAPPQFDDKKYGEMVRTLRSTKPPGETSLLLPFQTKQIHQEMYSDLIETGQVVLPSASDQFVNKVEAAQALVRVDPELEKHLTNPVAVNNTETLVTAINNREIAKQVIDECIKKETIGRKSYIKLDASGVSGIDNLSPNKYPQVYEGTYQERIDALTEIMATKIREGETYPSIAIEDRVAVAKDSFGVKEYVVSGVDSGNGFNTWGVVRTINDENDMYQGVIGSADPAKIGIQPEENTQLIKVVEKTSQAMRKLGYTFGYVSKDLMYDSERNDFVINDHNDRRGGRSFMEILIALYPGSVFMDRDFEFTVPEGKSATAYALEIAQNGFDQGFFIYGSPTIYYPTINETTGETKVKLKLVCEIPDDILQKPQNIVGEMDRHVRSLLIN